MKKDINKQLERYRLKDCAITQAEHMRAQVGDNTWHYAMGIMMKKELFNSLRDTLLRTVMLG
jgi:hypothetical protein